MSSNISISANNPSNTNNTAKRNDNHPNSNNTKQPNQVASKINNNNVQAKNPPQSNHNQQTNVIQNSQQQSKQPTQNYNNRENQNAKNITKPSNNQQSKQTPNHVPKQVQQNQQQPQRRTLQPLNSQQQQKQQQSPIPTQQQSKQLSQTDIRGEKPPDAVIFANHIKVRDEDTSEYTFGFFDEQTPNKQIQKCNVITNDPILKKSNSNVIINNVKKQTHPQNEQNLEKVLRSKPKQFKPSPNSEIRYKSNDNINANSFNYDQILKFISDCKYITLTFLLLYPMRLKDITNTPTLNLPSSLEKHSSQSS